MIKKCISTVLFIVVATAGVGIRAAEAAVPVTSANLCGWNCTDDSGVFPNDSADKLINTLAGVPSSGRPWIIALQEVCFSHIFYLANTLQTWGYSAHFGYSLSNPDMFRPGLDCHEFGNAVFMRGTLNSPNDKWKLTYASQNTTDTGRGEWRNATCMRMNSNFLGLFYTSHCGP
ncbi:MAG: hypothetical protein ACSLFB_06210 [Acidimicrobiales bacterium]